LLTEEWSEVCRQQPLYEVGQHSRERDPYHQGASQHGYRVAALAGTLIFRVL